MESECEMCGGKDMTGTWHDLCFTCVGKLGAENAKLKKENNRLKGKRDHRFMYFGSQKTRRCADCCKLEDKQDG